MTNVNWRTLDGLGGSAICPRCHPDAVGSRQRPSATARAFAEADAAGEEAKRILANGGAGGYKPYQNPKDQSVYLDPIS